MKHSIIGKITAWISIDEEGKNYEEAVQNAEVKLSPYGVKSIHIEKFSGEKLSPGMLDFDIELSHELPEGYKNKEVSAQ